jgi:thiamine-monophosphate kinase
MSEFDPETDMIQAVFAPLSIGVEGAYGLRDDVAFIPSTGHGLIVTQDQVIEGTHFYPNDPLEMIAKRLVRRNLSDMIAKGGVPTAAFLSLAWPKAHARTEISRFAQGLGEDLRDLCGGIPLLGGDTSTLEGPLVASLTLLGTPTAPSGQPVLRSGALAGDVIAVTGVIGDAWMGRMVREGMFKGRNLANCLAFAMAPYPPPLQIAPLIGQYAHASLDVSDGLFLDAYRLAAASGVRLEIELECLPVSDEVSSYDFPDMNNRNSLLATGGDDYQPLLAISEADFRAFEQAAASLGVTLTKIGMCREGEGLGVSYNGEPMELPLSLGWGV